MNIILNISSMTRRLIPTPVHRDTFLKQMGNGIKKLMTGIQLPSSNNTKYLPAGFVLSGHNVPEVKAEGLLHGINLPNTTK